MWTRALLLMALVFNWLAALYGLALRSWVLSALFAALAVGCAALWTRRRSGARSAGARA